MSATEATKGETRTNSEVLCGYCANLSGMVPPVGNRACGMLWDPVWRVPVAVCEDHGPQGGQDAWVTDADYEACQGAAVVAGLPNLTLRSKSPNAGVPGE